VIYMCYICAMEDKKQRSYAKESNKSKPSGVRFDLEKVEFLKKKENLNTFQKVVDFLLNKYWWEYKVAIPTHKGLPPSKDFYDAEKIDKIKHDEFEQWQEVELPHEKQKSIAEWVLEKREITDDDIDTYQKFIKRLNGVNYLTEKEKKEIKFA
jgi:hypothetical protein